MAAQTIAALPITDGDTIREGALRVRIWGIEAPEMDTRRGPSPASICAT